MSHAATLTTRAPSATSWPGRGLTAVVVLFMVFDGVITSPNQRRWSTPSLNSASRCTFR